MRASREQANLLRTCLQGDCSIVEGRRAGAQHGDLATFETREVDVAGGMKNARLSGITPCARKRREWRHVGCASTIPPACQHDLARVHGLGASGPSQFDANKI